MDFPSGNPDTMTISMTPTSGQDLALIVYCDQVSSNLSDGLAVSDTGAGGGTEVVTVSNVVAGTSLYIVVDGYSTGATPPGPSGPYSLNITSNGTTQPAATCGVVAGADVSATKTVAATSAPVAPSPTPSPSPTVAAQTRPTMPATSSSMCCLLV